MTWVPWWLTGDEGRQALGAPGPSRRPLPPCSGFSEILEGDWGGCPGAKAGDADLDYEIVDRAGECVPLPTSAADHLPGLGQERA